MDPTQANLMIFFAFKECKILKPFKAKLSLKARALKKSLQIIIESCKANNIIHQVIVCLRNSNEIVVCEYFCKLQISLQ